MAELEKWRDKPIKYLAEEKRIEKKYNNQQSGEDCCIEFCEKLDEWIQDEENATKEYHLWAKKAKNNNQSLVGTILETLSIDENKHAMALSDAAMIVCTGTEPPYQTTKNIKIGKKQVTFYE